jgi:Domain of unknown function (DUF6458)
MTNNRLREGWTTLDASVCTFLVIMGAILALAVEVSIPGINLKKIGVILFLVGIAGLCTSILDQLGLLAAMAHRLGVPLPNQGESGDSDNHRPR